MVQAPRLFIRLWRNGPIIIIISPGLKLTTSRLALAAVYLSCTIRQIDFAASDVPQSLSALHKNQWQQFPAAMGAIVLAIHLQGVPNNQLVLSGPVIAAIYQGKIQYWNDPALLKLNPHANLPKQRIIAITRSDGSGTTYNFTHYLSQVAPSWGRHNFFYDY